MNRIWTSVDFSHVVIREYCKPGAICFDATVGNGFDTMFLLEVLNGTGLVIGTDIQQYAIESTKLLLQKIPFENYRLFVKSHEKVIDILSSLQLTMIDVATFNCGYLPKGDKSIVTNADSTVNALEQCCEILALGGVITVVLYNGHEHGKIESERVRLFAENLNKNMFHVISYNSINQIESPECIVIRRSS